MDMDIRDAMKELRTLKLDKDNAWMPMFDPQASEISDTLDHVVDFQLDREQLIQLGKDVTALRIAINNRADHVERFGFVSMDERGLVDQANEKFDKIHKFSSKIAIMHERQPAEGEEKPTSVYYKRRSLNKLSAMERIAIVHASIVELRSNHDIAD